MGQLVTTGATLKCSFGNVPSKLNVTSQSKCVASGKPIATIKDAAATTNISNFGMCSSMLNPQVIAATSAALGVLSPQPCQFVSSGLWMCKSKCNVGGAPGLTSEGTLMCTMGAGSITVAASGQTKTTVN